MRCFWNALAVFVCLSVSSLVGTPTADAADRAGNQQSKVSEPTPASPAEKAVADYYGNLPLSFEANQGQTDGQVRFLSRGSGYSFFLTRNSALLTFAGDVQSHATALHMELEGASPNAQIRGLDELPGKSNYFLGKDALHWRTSVPTYAKVAYDNIYPGISLVYYGSQRQLEYDFVLSPGADAKQIRLAISGAQKLSVDQGNLVLHSASGDVQLLAPEVYQEINGQKHIVAGQWILAANNTAGFRMGDYDHTKALIIDPVLQYSSFLGGSQKNALTRVAIDASGNAYVAGYTTSGDFPAAPTPMAQTFGNGTPSRGAFVAKIDPTGSTLLYSTYLSGSVDEEATGLAVDSAGNIYVAGTTHSPDFPTRNALQPTCPTHTQAGTCSSAFLTKISPSGDSLLFSSYLGGSGGESARGLAVDATGRAYVLGVTSSVDFPVTAGAAQPKCGGTCQQNAFVAKYSTAGDRLAYATYLGGSGADDSADIAVDASGSAYIAGYTTSPDFPAVIAFQKSCAPDPLSSSGACVATGFVTKLKADGSAFVYSTYLGGTLGSQATDIAVDSQGSAYVTGSTVSADFPVVNPYQKSCVKDASSGLCSVDAFVTKFAPSGKTLVYSTYLGGSGKDEASGIAVDPAGNAHIVGRTESVDFPAVAPTQKQLKGASDAFVARLNAAGSALSFSTYHGGSALDSGNGMALDAKGNVYLTGTTSSPDFPTLHPFQSSCAGTCTSAFVSKMALPAPPAGPPASISATAGTPQNATIGTAFATHLAATVLDGSSNPVPGVVVAFTAPASGASGTFSDSTTNTTTATTNASGVATAATFTANTSAGAYTVQATVSGVATPADFSLTNNPGAPASIAATAGSGQSATIGTAFTTNLAAIVKDASNNPVPNVTVTFTAPASGASGTFTGSVTTKTATTNASGIATAPTFTANTTSGAYTVHATVSGVATPADFALTNNAGPPASIAPTAGSGQSTAEGTAFTTDLAATVKDASNNPVPNVTVTFTAPASGASGTFPGPVTTANATTNASGVATAPVFTANATLGTYTVQATVSGVATPADFSLTNTVGAPASIATNAGTPQSIAAGTAFATNLAAIVKDSGNNPVPAVTVTFTAPSSGSSGTFAGGGTTTTATTNSSGIATAAVLTANCVLGSFNVSGSVSGVVTPATFALTITVGPPKLVSPSAGTPQTTVVNTAFGTSLGATVTDCGNNPVPSVLVTFTAPSSGASGAFSGSSTTTATSNGSGVATASTFTANTTAGAYTVQATVSGVASPANFAMTNNPGAPSSVSPVSATTPQTAVVNTNFGAPLGALVADQFGNHVLAGITVTFTAPSSGASGNFADSGTNTTSANTNASGIATPAAFKANTIASATAYTVVGSATGATSASYALTNAPGASATITPAVGTTPQVIPVTNTFPTALSGTVTDQFGNTVLAGTIVTLTAPSSGASGSFLGGVRTATTNSSGVFTAAAFTANASYGTYQVTATAGGVTSPVFTLTNTDFSLSSSSSTPTIYIQGQSTPFAPATKSITTVTALPTPSGTQPSYTGTVTLGCSASSLPSGVTCTSFTPASASFTNGGPAAYVPSSLALSTSTTTPVGLYSAAIAPSTVGVDSSNPKLMRSAGFSLAVQCVLSLQQVIPTFTPATTTTITTPPTTTPNQYSFGVSVAQGGRACPYGSLPVAGGVTPGAVATDGQVATNLLTGNSGTATSTSPQTVTFEVGQPGTTVKHGFVTVPYFDATQTATNQTVLTMPVTLAAQIPIIADPVSQTQEQKTFSLSDPNGGSLTIPSGTGVPVCGAVSLATGQQYTGITCTVSGNQIALTALVPQTSASLQDNRALVSVLFAFFLPGIVVLGTGFSAFTRNGSRQNWIKRIVCMLVVLALLVLLSSCGGGFSPAALKPTGTGKSFTVTVMGYTTSGTSVQGIDIFTIQLTL